MLGHMILFIGWYKAIVLWLFTLCSAAGIRNLLAHMLFGGLLPGEEYIDHEAFQTVIVRLIPYWFNQWEQQWGVECTSLLFELPYFAAELLVILPFVQVHPPLNQTSATSSGTMHTSSDAPTLRHHPPARVSTPPLHHAILFSLCFYIRLRARANHPHMRCSEHPAPLCVYRALSPPTVRRSPADA